MERLTYGQTETRRWMADRQTDRQVHKRTDWQGADWQTDRLTDERIEGETVGWIELQMDDRQLDAEKGRLTEECPQGQTDR